MANVSAQAPIAKTVNFRYEGLDLSLKRVKGNVKAPNEMAAQNLLVGRGYSSLSLEPVPSFLSLKGMLPSLFKVKTAQVVSFSRHLATLLESGITLLPALQLLSQQRSSSAPFRRVLRFIASDLSTGNSLSQAVSRRGKVFNEMYRRTIEVGERSGRLEVVLKELADYIESQEAVGKKLRSAMTYPAILLIVGILVTIVLLVVVLPPLAEMFEQLNAEVPLPTRILLAASDFVVGYYLYLLGTLTVLAGLIAFYWKHPKGQRAKAWLMFNIPVIGTPVLMAELARMSRTMSLMLSAGLPLQEVMEVLPRTTSNILIREALSQMRERLFLGEGLAYPMAANPMFPPLMLQMVRVGEDSNSLPITMGVVADFYEAEAAERTQTMVALITPLSTIFLAGMVGFIALSVIMPMYNLTGAF